MRQEIIFHTSSSSSRSQSHKCDFAKVNTSNSKRNDIGIKHHRTQYRCHRDDRLEAPAKQKFAAKRPLPRRTASRAVRQKSSWRKVLNASQISPSLARKDASTYVCMHAPLTSHSAHAPHILYRPGRLRPAETVTPSAP
jgi:hypothetical protein